MQAVLLQRLHGYIVQHNPDLLLQLQGEGQVTAYLENKVAELYELIEQLQTDGTPGYIIEERCMEALTAELRPSKYGYVLAVLEEEFAQEHAAFREAGILTQEVANMISACEEVFTEAGFTESNEGNRLLHLTVTGTIREYLDKQK